MLKNKILLTKLTFLVACFLPAPARNYFLLFGLHFLSIYADSFVQRIETMNYRMKYEELDWKPYHGVHKDKYDRIPENRTFGHL